MCGSPSLVLAAARGPAVRARHLPAERDFSSAVLRAAASPTLDQQATSILPPLNVKTARSWRGIVPFTHLARASRVAGTSRPSALAVYQERRPANTLSRYHHEISRVSAYLIMAASVSGPTMPSMSPW